MALKGHPAPSRSDTRLEDHPTARPASFRRTGKPSPPCRRSQKCKRFLQRDRHYALTLCKRFSQRRFTKGQALCTSFYALLSSLSDPLECPIRWRVESPSRRSPAAKKSSPIGLAAVGDAPSSLLSGVPAHVSRRDGLLQEFAFVGAGPECFSGLPHIQPTSCAGVSSGPRHGTRSFALDLALRRPN